MGFRARPQQQHEQEVARAQKQNASAPAPPGHRRATGRDANEISFFKGVFAIALTHSRFRNRRGSATDRKSRSPTAARAGRTGRSKTVKDAREHDGKAITIAQAQSHNFADAARRCTSSSRPGARRNDPPPARAERFEKINFQNRAPRKRQKRHRENCPFFAVRRGHKSASAGGRPRETYHNPRG